MDELASRFVGEVITVAFDQEPLMSKRPPCPDRLIWGEERLEIVAKLAEWQDYQRRGRMARNMQPAHLRIAAQRGSWGVGRFFFRVKVADGRIFDIYYDRAPQDADRRDGGWFLYRELYEHDRD